MPKIIHYRERCIGCNSCVEHAPDFWSIDEKDGRSRLTGSTEKNGTHVGKIDLTDVEQNERAARDCPVKIIKMSK